jgi:hypothetical protein
MDIVGICRFSLIGTGDWKGVSSADNELSDDFVAQRCAQMFTEERMNVRFRMFEHLTLASLKAQKDPDFIFIVLASDLMPDVYKRRLITLCATVPQAKLHFSPPIDVIGAQRSAMSKLGLEFSDIIQFRLDDDDALSIRYVHLLRTYLSRLIANGTPLAMSLTDIVYSVLGRDRPQRYHWHSPFFSCGAAMFHPSRSIYSFGHFAIPQRMPALTIPLVYGIVTHNGTNDTTALIDRPAARRQMRALSDEDMERIVSRDLTFLTPQSREIAGLSTTVAAD